MCFGRRNGGRRGCQPDISCREPDLLLRVADWRRLGFLRRLAVETDPVLHSGSWIAYGTPQRHALGRYFVASSVRHGDALTQAILAWKNRSDLHPAIARALTLLGDRVTDQADVTSSRRFHRAAAAATDSLRTGRSRLMPSMPTTPRCCGRSAT